MSDMDAYLDEQERQFEAFQRGECTCGRGPHYPQHDYYGIYAGKMCDECFEEKYIQGPYDFSGAGERLEPNY